MPASVPDCTAGFKCRGLLELAMISVPPGFGSA
jgi:hypothetical protein